MADSTPVDTTPTPIKLKSKVTKEEKKTEDKSISNDVCVSPPLGSTPLQPASHDPPSLVGAYNDTVTDLAHV